MDDAMVKYKMLTFSTSSRAETVSNKYNWIINCGTFSSNTVVQNLSVRILTISVHGRCIPKASIGNNNELHISTAGCDPPVNIAKHINHQSQ